MPEGPGYFTDGWAYLNGSFVRVAEAKVSIFDRSFLYGDGVFEALRFRHGRLFRLDAHLDRLEASARALAIQLPVSRSELAEAAAQLIHRNGLGEGYLRIVISRGEGYPSCDPRFAGSPTLAISVQPTSPLGDAGRGLRLSIVQTRRTPPECIDPRVKSNNYLNHILAKLQAIAAHADDAIMLDHMGGIAECATRNIFAFTRGVLATPPNTYLLNGITRATILDLARGQSELIQRVEERAMTPYDLYTADEVFVTGTGSGIAAVLEIDGRSIGNGQPGAVTNHLRMLYEQMLDSDASEALTPAADVARPGVQ